MSDDQSGPGDTTDGENATREGNATGSDADHENASESDDRHEVITVHPTNGSHNSLQGWYRARNPLRLVLNYLVVVVCRISPSLKLKRVLFRALGMDVGRGVAWGLESTPDVFWPELITVEDHAVIGYDATILCHEFLIDEYRTGRVVIREGAMIGAGAVVLPGVEVGEGARVAANSLVVEDVPPETTVAGVPATVSGDARSDDGAGGDDETGDDETGE